MSKISKLGTIVRTSDGRLGTVVFNGLSGVGIKWGIHYPDPEDFKDTTADLFRNEVPEHMIKWIPDAMLRDQSLSDLLDMDCVGEEWTVEIVEEDDV